MSVRSGTELTLAVPIVPRHCNRSVRKCGACIEEEGGRDGKREALGRSRHPACNIGIGRRRRAAARDAALTTHAAAKARKEDEGGDDGDGDLRKRGVGGW